LSEALVEGSLRMKGLEELKGYPINVGTY
jgi:hypothetical protein